MEVMMKTRRNLLRRRTYRISFPLWQKETPLGSDRNRYLELLLTRKVEVIQQEMCLQVQRRRKKAKQRFVKYAWNENLTHGCSPASRANGLTIPHVLDHHFQLVTRLYRNGCVLTAKYAKYARRAIMRKNFYSVIVAIKHTTHIATNHL
mmetsp:Transcript_31182/g.81811  ORF Transcript_31182/g.81811 Transcript_31182/m.81811 type:complete len:149 (-) Transcript_31182:981-1427(-)